MRKSISVLLAAGLVFGSLAAPAAAGKKKKSKTVTVSDSFSATLAPFPKLTAWGDPLGLTEPGCTAGEEGVHWVGEPFTSPGKGTLTMTMEGFQGDWDMYVFGTDGTVLAISDAAQVNATDPAAPAPPEESIELPLTKGQEIVMAMCNWLGEPDNTVNYEGKFKV